LVQNKHISMLEAGGNRWCCSWVLVEKKPGDTWIHKGTLALSTWMHVERVMDNMVISH